MLLPKALTIDFETRSAIPLDSSLTYARHESTAVMCLSCQWLEEERGRVYLPKQGGWVFRPGIDFCPPEIVFAILHGIPIYAHNSGFDSNIYEHVCVARLGWPPIPVGQWRCTLAICSYYALPRKLKDAAAALGLPAKDMEGNKVMKQISKPRKPGKRDIEKWLSLGGTLETLPIKWWEDRNKQMRNALYCQTDTAVQTQILRTLGPLPPERLREWQFHQVIGRRGVPLDVENLEATEQLLDISLKDVNQQVKELTRLTHMPGGMVTSIMQRDRILEWCEMQGFSLLKLDEESVDAALEIPTLPPPVRVMLNLRQAAGKSSIAKVGKMLDCMDDDGRCREGTLWHGASTGRLAGRGVQWHNFPRDCMKPEKANEFHELLLLRGSGLLTDEEIIRAISPDMAAFPDVLTSALRSFVKASDGKSLLVSDFNAIECRVTAWITRCRLLLERFYAGDCPYCDFASRATGRKVIKSKTDEAMIKDRQLGKVAVLGLGYGMGAPKFITTAAKSNVILSEQQSESITDLFRTTYFEIPAFWKAVEKAMKQAIQHQTVVPLDRLSFGAKAPWAWIQLPSGRAIWYYDAKIVTAQSRFDPKKTQQEIRYKTIDSQRHRWVTTSTYGGKITENIVQAIAADLLWEAMFRVEAHGFPVILSVHDEVISEAENAEQRKLEFHELMRARPSWGTDCPVEAETHVMQRYGKP